MPVVTEQPEQPDEPQPEKPQAEPSEASPWGRSGTSWFVVLGVVAAVVVNFTVSGVAAAATLAVLAVTGGVLRLVLPRAAGLTVRSRAFDATLMLAFGVAIAVLAAIVPQ